MRDDVVIIISNHNYGRFVGCCIESCVKQAKVVIVDDASTDVSWQVISGYVKKFRNVSAIRLAKNSGGNARGKNVGIAKTQQEFIICLDSDDMLLPESVDVRMDNIGDYKWIHGKSVRVESVGAYKDIMASIDEHKKYSDTINDVYNKKIVRNNTNTLIRDLPESDLDWYRGVEASTVLARRSLYDQVGLYDEELRWKIDREMWYRLLKHGYSKKFIDYHVSIYRKHDKQVSKDRIRKPPAKINKLFDSIVKKRALSINKLNTSMLSDYNAEKHISEIIGDL